MPDSLEELERDWGVCKEALEGLAREVTIEHPTKGSTGKRNQSKKKPPERAPADDPDIRVAVKLLDRAREMGRSVNGASEWGRLQKIARDISDNLWRVARISEAWTIQPLRPSVSPPVEQKAAPDMGVSIENLPVTGKHLVDRHRELELLNRAWRDGRTHVVYFWAWGGVGKSALMNHWLAEMARDNYRGAERVFGWTFYSQESGERATTSDEFMATALRFFDAPPLADASPTERGLQLARLVQAHRTLLILDGLEPMQYGPGALQGWLKDRAMRYLIRALAAKNKGLCVITTRQRPEDLTAYLEKTVEQVNLDDLEPSDGATLLRTLGVKRLARPDEPQDQAAELEQQELETASEEFGGHALTLTLLGSYLAARHAGDVGFRREVKLLDERKLGWYADQVIASYEKWFGEGPAVALLRLLGFFDRPAEPDQLAALCAPPAIQGLTEPLLELTQSQWSDMVHHLRETGLLVSAPPGQDPRRLDAHHLVREYFATQLQAHNADAWREGNRRLFEYFQQAVPARRPKDVDSMLLLYRAVRHGCYAGLHARAYRDVYYKRVRQGGEYQATKKLALYAEEVAALACFFERTWDRPTPNLQPHEQARVLDAAGVALKAMGRLDDSESATQASIKLFQSTNLSREQAIATNHLLALQGDRGDLSQASESARSIEQLIRDSSDPQTKRIGLVALAIARHLIGEHDRAAQTFEQAEALQRSTDSKHPLLHGIDGFWYCELLLDRGEQLLAAGGHEVRGARGNHALAIFRQVRERAATILGWASELHWARETALHTLTLGRAQLLESTNAGGRDLEEASAHLNEAVELLRDANQLDHLPRGLIARAALFRHQGHYERAQSNLEEAIEIAQSGKMKRYFPAICLEWARLYLAQGDKEHARNSLDSALTHIIEIGNEIGYYPDEYQIDELEKQLDQ
jgi:tetratricopeptide (TPR) repeat protein